jgi:hypothetical protein
VRFRDAPTRDSFCDVAQLQVEQALAAGAPSDELWWPGLSKPLKRLGTGLDLLALGADGRLLAIEAKPADAPGGVVLAPAQVRLYAELFARWRRTTDAADTILNRQLRQRVELGLGRRDAAPLRAAPTVVPVVAVGAGHLSVETVKRFWRVAAALAASPSREPAIAPLELWRVDDNGEIVERSVLPV